MRQLKPFAIPHLSIVMIFAFGPNNSFYFNNGEKHYWYAIMMG